MTSPEGRSSSHPALFDYQVSLPLAFRYVDVPVSRYPFPQLREMVENGLALILTHSWNVLSPFEHSDDIFIALFMPNLEGLLAITKNVAAYLESLLTFLDFITECRYQLLLMLFPGFVTIQEQVFRLQVERFENINQLAASKTFD